MTMPIIEARAVRKTFHVSQGLFRGKKPLHAVNGVSLMNHFLVTKLSRPVALIEALPSSAK